MYFFSALSQMRCKMGTFRYDQIENSTGNLEGWCRCWITSPRLMDCCVTGWSELLFSPLRPWDRPDPRRGPVEVWRESCFSCFSRSDRLSRNWAVAFLSCCLIKKANNIKCHFSFHLSHGKSSVYSAETVTWDWPSKTQCNKTTAAESSRSTSRWAGTGCLTSFTLVVFTQALKAECRGLGFSDAPAVMDGLSLDNIQWEVGSATMKSSCKQQIRVWQKHFQHSFEYCNIWLPPEPKAGCVHMCVRLWRSSFGLSTTKIHFLFLLWHHSYSTCCVMKRQQKHIVFRPTLVYTWLCTVQSSCSQTRFSAFGLISYLLLTFEALPPKFPPAKNHVMFPLP